MIDLAYLPFRELTQLPRSTLISGFAFALFIILFTMVRGSSFLAMPMLAISIVLLCSYFSVMFFGRRSGKAVLFLLGGIVILEAGFNSSIIISKTDQEFQYEDRLTYTRFHDQMRALLDRNQTRDSGFYRIEKTFILTNNDDLSLGYNGISHSSSFFDQETFRF
jgi:uncharacterized membrane protein YfhO